MPYKWCVSGSSIFQEFDKEMMVESFLAAFAAKSRTSYGRECLGVLLREVAATSSWVI